ncbi:MAG: hypothetical protein LLF96_08285 [Eubacteriales bacterium]|nr:hypothetical protein [Eubacteriales bacterium]
MRFFAEAAQRTPNYFCTWAAQNYRYGCDFPALDSAKLEGACGARHARDSMNETAIFGPEGWANRFHPGAKTALYLLLDDGWDVPPEVDPAYFGSLIVDENRFPSCTGTPAERLARLNWMAKASGWRGIGLWVAAQEAPALMRGRNMRDPEWQKAYWMERLEWSRQAGVEYWKVDWGEHAHEWTFRENLTRWGREMAPSLTIEHAWCQSCVNDERLDVEKDPYDQQSLVIRTGRADAALIDRQKQLLTFSDVLRSYDVLPYLSQAQTIERVSRLLTAAQNETITGMGLINCEDEAYIAASLGLCSGVMRFPLMGLRPGTDMDCTFPASRRNTKRRMDEVARLTRFQALMPAFGVQCMTVNVDDTLLMDAWSFEPGQTWLSTAIHQVVEQSAPACVARGMKLPLVRAQGEPPFVLAAQHPNGTAAVATIGRAKVGDSYFTPLAEISLDLEGICSCLGVFGRYAALHLKGAGFAGKRFFARDLLGDRADDITASVTLQGDTVSLPGELIARVGLSRATYGDESEPGLVLEWR